MRHLMLPAVVAGAALVALPGCVSTQTGPRAEEAIQQALRTEEPIEFRVEGGPVDAEGPDTAELTEAEAIRSALRTDPALQEALAEVRVAEAAVRQAGLLPNPILSIVFRFPEGGGKTQIESGIAMDLLSLLTRPRRVSVAENRLRSAAADALAEALDVVSNARESYAAVQSAAAAVPVLEEQRQLAERVLGLARSRLEAGIASRQEVTAIESELVSLDVQIAEARRAERDVRLRLARVLGVPSAEPDWELEAWTAPPPTAAAEEAWVEAALARRPEVAAVRWELAALGDEAALAGLGAFEGLGAGAELVREDQVAAGPAVALPLPIFDMGQAERQRIAAEQAAARHRLVRAQRQAVEDVRRAYASLDATRENLRRIEDQLIPAQAERQRQVEAAFQAGFADLSDVLLAQRGLLEARARSVELQREVSEALLGLERAVGGPAAAGEASGVQDGRAADVDTESEGN